MRTRREFLEVTSAAAIGVMAMPNIILSKTKKVNSKSINKPIVISTWKHGIPANEAAWKVLSNNGTALDAVEQGVMIPEADPNVQSVGFGGWPDRDGYVTLDASIMDDKGNAGSVAFVQNYMHPISIARKVMEKTPHVMLVGTGAEKFAEDNGFKKKDLLTEESKKKWEEWVRKENYKPFKYDKENHDTIGMIALDNHGNLSGACTTSGLAWKIHGRVGDSPIIGDGMYVDNEIGAAAATGKGESVMKICGSFLVVELMRQGKTPLDACKLAIERIVFKQPDYKEFQVGFIALNKKGEYGYFSLQDGFEVAVCQNSIKEKKVQNILIKSDFYKNL